jgi:aspartyl-tRNA(Asn)/glutamyl-tRNA(Gln) amidotransferase subunit B
MEFEPVIGLEIHARIATKTKMFCRCANNIFDAEPNTHVCETCMGFPGTLPLTNEEAVKKGIIMALALGCEIREFSKFDRKSYFYPDLPKGFQISQYDRPISEHGKITITLKDGSTKEIRVMRLHLEDDAGKLTHVGDGTLVDLNRAGTPLMEIVSEADMNSVEEASLYARQIQKIVRYVGASDADMEKGMMRFDINVSLRPKGETKFGTRSECKNLNSFRSLEKALEYEIRRQTEILNGGGKVVQETLGWDDERGITVSQRSKEEAADYRYFPEPDIPPLVITREMVEELRKGIPELPEAKAVRYQSELDLPVADSRQLAESLELSDYFEKAFKVSNSPKKTANWVLVELMAILNAKGATISDCKLSPENLGKMVKLIEDGAITGKIAKEIFPELFDGNLEPQKLIDKKGIKVMGDSGELEKICAEIVAKNPQSIADFKAGKERALGALVGQVMGATKGSANPKMVNEILRKKLSEL